MDLVEVAQQALKIFADEKRDFGFESSGGRIAICGYLEGVIAGRIRVGQAWLANLLIKQTVSHLHQEEQGTIQKIFASGMCCDGQQLSREGNRAVRSGR